MKTNTELKILIIEDDLTDIALLKKAFKQTDYEDNVIICNTGNNALNSIKENNPTIIVTDVNLPDYSGFDIIKFVREDLQLLTPIIILSTSNSCNDIKKTYKLNANAYIIKPHCINDLYDIIKTTIKFWIDIAKTI